MPRHLLWRLTLVGALPAITIFDVANSLPRRSADSPSPASSSPVAATTNDAQFVSELTPDGFLKSSGAPEPVRIAAAKARSLFRATRWDEFVVRGERLTSAGEWTVRMEPRSGPPDDVMWVKVRGEQVTSFGFRRKDKLKGYTGKSKKGVEPGFCR
jgi:hypothetical protein